MKQLVDIGVWQYTHDSYEEAVSDARVQATKSGEAQYIMQDQDYYFGPMNLRKRESFPYRNLTEAQVVNGE